MASGPARPAKVLVADDDPDILQLVEGALARLPAEVRVVGDGQAALDAFEESRPDCVVLDMNMPRLTGVEVCRRMKALLGEAYLPVVMITSSDEREIREDALDGGADEYVVKPFSPFELRSRVRPLLRAKALYDDLQRTRAELSELKGSMRDRGRRLLAAPVRKEVTILFSDVRNFTQISDQLDPEEVHAMLDGYVAQAADAVIRHGGTINKIMGDGIMALFGDRDDRPDHALRGLRAAVEMSERAAAFQARMHTLLPEAFTIGIGVHTGAAIIGTLGRGEHVDYTAIGSSVNLASRLQALSTDNRVVASAATYDPLRGRVDLRNERREQMRGFAHPIRVAEIVGVT